MIFQARVMKPTNLNFGIVEDYDCLTDVLEAFPEIKVIRGEPDVFDVDCSQVSRARKVFDELRRGYARVAEELNLRTRELVLEYNF